MDYLCGVDIGGTKCAVSIGQLNGKDLRLIDKRYCPTLDPRQTIDLLLNNLEELLVCHDALEHIASIGISCGSPLDPKRGVILSPPNLPLWNDVHIVDLFKERFGVPTGLQNDANACALAEWQWGAGQGTQNMIFLTFGTGMGAGLILNGRLYNGANHNAGEIGHIRMESRGPTGYEKAGSLEGFCSGGGIARAGQDLARKWFAATKTPLAFCSSALNVEHITAKDIGVAAQSGDKRAREIFHRAGVQLGRGLAILVDLLNPERIIIGGIFHRQLSLLKPIVLETLRSEALSHSLLVCEVVPAGLGELVGDFAGMAVGLSVMNP